LTISSLVRTAGPFIGNGAQVAFSFAFKVFQNTDLLVQQTDLMSVQTTLAYGTGYSVALNVDQNTAPGGTVTLTSPLTNLFTLFITSNVPQTQPASLTNAGGFFPKTIEDALDRQTIIFQQATTSLGQAIRVPELSGIPILPTAAARAGTVQGWDALGNPAQVAVQSPGSFTYGQRVIDSFTGDGASTVFTLSANPGSQSNIQVNVGGVTQRDGLDFAWNGNLTVTFSTAPPASVFVDISYVRALPMGASDAGSTAFLQTGAGAVTRTVQTKLAESVSVLDFIPVSEHAAIKAGTSVLDVTDYFNAAIAAAKTVHVPGGSYFTKRPINMTGRGVQYTYWGRRLIGEGASNTIINAYTGVYPCIDCTGMNTGEVFGINVRSDNPSYAPGLTAADCASIGLTQGRGLVSTSCNQLRLRHLRFNMASIIARNAGTGTIGICNNGGEHVLRESCEIYANLPLVDHNGLQFAVASSSAISPQYEAPFVGSISCLMHENRSLILVSLDSFRAWWTWQVGQVNFENLYTSTRTYTPGFVTPAYLETFCITGSATNVDINCYQEASGLFGTTYRMDHRYVTFGAGFYEDIDIVVQRAGLDAGYPLPGAPVESIGLVEGTTLSNCRINCNYVVTTYNASGDNNGFAPLPVTWAGTNLAIQSVDFILDAATHSANIFSVIGPYCTNVKSTNWRSGLTMRCDLNGVFLPVAVGLSSAGTGTYTFQLAKFEREGQWCRVTIKLSWSAHTGNGGLSISGLPFTSDVDMEQAVACYSDGMVIAGSGAFQVVGWIPNNGTTIQVRRIDITGGASTGVAIDGTVAELLLTGTYRIADGF
jgi:hypothetical protein